MRLEWKGWFGKGFQLAFAATLSAEREDELVWRERALDEKEHELNRIEETLAETQ
jgi:hypothetical protein